MRATWAGVVRVTRTHPHVRAAIGAASKAARASRNGAKLAHRVTPDVDRRFGLDAVPELVGVTLEEALASDSDNVLTVTLRA